MILKSDVLDIVFENRNKSYGAYNLRKFYNNRLMKSLGAMLAVVIVLSAFTFLPKKKVNPVREIYEVTTVVLKEQPKEKHKEKEPEKPKEAVKPPAQVPTQVFTQPKIVPEKVPVAPIENLKDSIAFSSVKTEGQPGGVALVNVPAVTDGGVTGTSPEPAKIDANTPMSENEVEVMPSFPGGIEALRKFLARNLQNPKDMDAGEMVSVKVKFVVDQSGKLKSFETVQDGGEEFNKEVIRVLKKMPQWTPGKSRGQDVSVYYTIPVKFVAADE